MDFAYHFVAFQHGQLTVFNKNFLLKSKKK